MAMGYMIGKTMTSVATYTPYFEGYTALPVFTTIKKRNHIIDASEALRMVDVGKARQLGKRLEPYTIEQLHTDMERNKLMHKFVKDMEDALFGRMWHHGKG